MGAGRRLLQHFELQTERYNMESLRTQIHSRIQLSEMIVHAYVKDLCHLITDELSKKNIEADILVSELRMDIIFIWKKGTEF